MIRLIVSELSPSPVALPSKLYPISSRFDAPSGLYAEMNAHSSLAQEPNQDRDLLSASFNQDQGCFSIAYEHGFRVYNTDPMELRVKREFSDGGIGISQMLHRTNYLALVGGGRNPKFPQNKVIIWDDLKHKSALSLEFLSPVLNVLMSRTRIIAILKNKIHVYAFSSPPTKIASYETIDNPHGIGCLSNNVLAFPGRGQGQVQIVNLATSMAASSSGTGNHDDSPSGAGLVSIVRAHRGNIRCLSLNPSGTVVATASDIGTIIRLHSTENTALLHEFRRGLDRAIIFSMAFSQSSNRLAVLSDKNTLHVFDTTLISTPNPSLSTSAATNGMGGGQSSSTPISAPNRRHVLGKLPLMPRYFSSEWSFASARIEGQQHSGPGILGWSSDESVVVIWIRETKWEKYVIVERDYSSSVTDRNSTPETQWELVREAWRGFEGISYD
ncbi:Hsv2p [Sugiyamaella lignohabitans]|uniref:Hsv2p n=1 Tax=Sugiyamaella lignohabitans TaxID=796027 RepID=A0A167DKN6_9ASCO|nr:Hsv2p [Sugiyamaella lignohabitans]ANB13019.1 Hsv2p [Sugiyamaella lignohabitans]